MTVAALKQATPATRASTNAGYSCVMLIWLLALLDTYVKVDQDSNLSMNQCQIVWLRQCNQQQL